MKCSVLNYNNFFKLKYSKHTFGYARDVHIQRHVHMLDIFRVEVRVLLLVMKLFHFKILIVLGLPCKSTISICKSIYVLIIKSHFLFSFILLTLLIFYLEWQFISLNTYITTLSPAILVWVTCSINLLFKYCVVDFSNFWIVIQ